MKNLYISACLLTCILLVSCKKDKEDTTAKSYPATADLEFDGAHTAEPIGMIRMPDGKFCVTLKVRGIFSPNNFIGIFLLDDSKAAQSLVASKAFLLNTSENISGNMVLDPADGRLQFLYCDSFEGFAQFKIGKTSATGMTSSFNISNHAENWYISDIMHFKNSVLGFGAIDSTGLPNLGVRAFNVFGAPLWTFKLGGAASDKAITALELCDGNIGIIGTTDSYGKGSWDIWYIKINEMGQMISSTVIGQAGPDEPVCVVKDDQCRLYIAGRTKSASSQYYDGMLVCIDQNGTELWRKTYGDPGRDEGFEAISLLPGKGLLIAGFMKPVNLITKNAEVRAIDFSGNEQWLKSYKHEGFSITPREIIADDKHLYVVCASFNSQPGTYFIKDLLP